MAKSMVEMCSEIVTAQAGHTQMVPADICESLQHIFRTLQEIHQAGETEITEEPIIRDPQLSIQRNHVICLVCNKSFKLLSNRHLALHEMTPREYKKKYGIRMTQPLSARTLTARRRKLAKKLGMGKQLAEWRAERKERHASTG